MTPYSKRFLESRGARTGVREGLDRVLAFRSFEEDYAALDGGCAIFDLSDRGVLMLAGDDRVRFLNGLVTNDVGGLKPGQGCRACQLDRQSHVLSDLCVYAFEAHFLLETEPGQGPAARQHLERYKIADRVSFDDKGEETALLSLQGPRSAHVLQSVFGRAAAEAGQLPEHGHVSVDGGRGITLIRTRRTGRPGMDLLLKAGEGPAVWEALVGAGASPAGWLALEAGRIESGNPRFGADFTKENLFMEVGLPEAVSFSKGCYVGQEIVARVKSRGHVNRQIAGLLVDGLAEAGDLVFEGGRTVGRVTSASPSPKFGTTVALALLKRELADNPGAACAVRGEPSGVMATVAALPFSADRQP